MEDRNRTAPFPFCGNRFEFRAVGSSQCLGGQRGWWLGDVAKVKNPKFNELAPKKWCLKNYILVLGGKPLFRGYVKLRGGGYDVERC